jgi:hypothetical protein
MSSSFVSGGATQLGMAGLPSVLSFSCGIGGRGWMVMARWSLGVRP